MSGPNELKAALQRLIDGDASEADRAAVRAALNAGVLVTGDNAAAIGGNASDVILITGDGNIVFKGADAALSSVAPTRLHEVPRPPDDFTGREDELKELLAATTIVKYRNLSPAIGDRRGEGNDLGGLGLAYAAVGETRRAIQFDEQYLTIARELGDRRGEGNALGNLGVAYADLGEPRPAIQFYEQALHIHREIGDRRGEGNALWNLSLALDQLGEHAQAIQHAEQALTILEQIEDPSAAKVRAQLAAWREQPGS